MSGTDSDAVMVVLTTAPSVDAAEQIGSTLVEERLSACVNVVEGVTSIYRWKGGVEREREVLMVLKTTANAVERLKLRLVALHPYEVPEILAIEPSDGHLPYLDWVRAEVGGDG